MKCLLVTHIGGEDIAAAEIEEITAIKGEKVEGGVLFDAETHEDLFKLIYFTQSALNVLLLDYEEFTVDGRSFAVRGDNIEEAADVIGKKANLSVNLKKPDLHFISYKEYVGLDFSGDLGKRDYRVFTNKHTLKGTVAYIILKESGYTGKESILDPYSKDGTIMIEAAHYATKRSINYYCREKFNFISLFPDFDFDEFFECFEETKLEGEINVVSTDARDISAAKKNAKIAGVNKLLKFSRQDTEWLDLKFEVDILVTYLPTLNAKRLEIFYEQAKKISGKVVLLSNESAEGKTLMVGKSKKKIVILQ